MILTNLYYLIVCFARLSASRPAQVKTHAHVEMDGLEMERSAIRPVLVSTTLSVMATQPVSLQLPDRLVVTDHALFQRPDRFVVPDHALFQCPDRFVVPDHALCLSSKAG